MKNYEKLRALLSEEIYPHLYVHKFIGLNTPAFRAAVEALEAKFPDAIQVSARESAPTSSYGEANYLAYTYELTARNADEIIALLEQTATLPDLKVVL
jgi:putative lipoic acid-binding regulatory protein